MKGIRYIIIDKLNETLIKSGGGIRPYETQQPTELIFFSFERC